MKRASVMQIFSNAGQDEPEKIHAEASKFIPAETVPSKFANSERSRIRRIVLVTDETIPVETPEDFFKYNFGYDIVRDSTQSMTREVPEWELPATFFEKEPGAGIYP
jgi:salicylate hydroxylase